MIGSSPSHILRPEELPAKNRGGGASTIPLVTYPRGATAFLNGMTIFEPGAQIGHHSHNVVESVVVIEGTAIIDIDGTRSQLSTFDTTFVPANIPHHFENASDSEPMRIIWTYASVDSTRTLVESGEYGRIDGESTTQPTATNGSALASEKVTEVVRLHVVPGAEAEFEQAVKQAAGLFQRAAGARTFELERSIEDPSEYRLEILWERLSDHTEGFRGSEAFQQWRELVTPHLVEPPSASHFAHVFAAF